MGVAAAIGAVVLMFGAIATRLRAGGDQRNPGVTADALLLSVAAATAVTAFTLNGRRVQG